MARIAALFAALVSLAVVAPTTAPAEPRPAIALNAEPALPPGFDHVPWANPEAPKGGRVTLGAVGSFDSLNPFVYKGNAVTGLYFGAEGSNVYENLMERSPDEPFTLYGLLAEWIDVADDRSTVTFRLRDEARFSDRTPVLADEIGRAHV